MNKIPNIVRTLLTTTVKYFFGMALLLLLAVSANAQDTTRSTTDGKTPLALTPGAPAGSYALSGFDNINYYNGNLNFHLPLLGIGGRGQAQMTMMLAIDSKGWHVKHHDVFIPDPNCGSEWGGGDKCVDGGYYADSNSPEPNRWSPSAGYGVGMLFGRSTGVGSNSCDRSAKSYGSTLTRLTFITADGTEYELRDQLYAGQPQPVTGGPCNGGAVAVSRGTIFESGDGNAATFISDQAINDHAYAGPEGTERIYPSGDLLLKDGMRYRIDDGRVTWMRDRNGNMLSFSYDTSQRVTTITDSLNRQVTVEYDVTDAAPYGLCNRITYRGFGGTQRVIRVSSTSLSNVLRSGYTIKTYKLLFPELNNSSNVPWNPNVVSAVWLPDGRSYKFFYNDYGELARVELPTGGAVEYDHTAGSGCLDDLGSNCTDPTADVQEIYRRVLTKRVYKDGTTLESKTTISNPVTTHACDTCVPESVVTADHLDSANHKVVHEKHYYYGDPVESLFSAPTSYPGWKESREFKTEIHDTSSTEANPKVLRSVENTWAQRTPLPAWYSGPSFLSPDKAPAFDVRLVQTVTTLKDTGADPNKVSKQTFSYDQYNNQTDVYEYDYGDGAPGAFRRRTHTDYLTSNPINGADYDSLLPNATSPDVDATIHLRNLPTQQWVSADAAGTQKKAITTYEYDQYTGTSHAGLVTRLNISGLDTAFALSSKQTRGNVTAVSHRLIQNNNREITSYQQYDVAGNVVKAIDANGNATQFDFTDRFGAPNDNEAQSNDSPQELAQAGKLSYAFATKVTLPLVGNLSQVAYMQYDYYLGKPVNAEDANGTVYAGYYNDVLDRPTQLVTAYADATLRHQTKFVYDDSNHTITTTADRSNYNDNLLKSQVVYDRLGRTIKSLAYEDATRYILVEQQYDALGRVSQRTNPYRPQATPAETPQWTSTSYDELGRVISVTTPDGAKVLTTYSGNRVTVRDQASKDRQSVTDALGRLTEVVEDPGTGGLNYQTTYTYDVLDDLVQVQQGNQTRTFSYDSLKRLTQATNPESGTVSYEYDDDGNLTQKQDARSVTSTYAYDVLNRIKTRSYSDGTPAVTYTYDNGALPSGAPLPTEFTRGASIGRLVAVTYGTGGTGSYYGYDALGRVSQSLQKTDTLYGMKYTYDRAGNLLTEQYPSGRVVKSVYDGAGRISTLTGTMGTQTKTYASQFAYASQGAVAKVKLGNGLWEHTTFNTRLQPTEIGLGLSALVSDQLKLSYDYGTATANNGNLVSQTINVPAIANVRQLLSVKQTYTYDSLNRLATAREVKTADSSQTFKQVYSYTDENGDGGEYGNLRLNWTASTSNVRSESASQVPSISSANNRITSAGYSYDAAGNMTAAPDKLYGGPNHDYTFDAENRMVTFDSSADHETRYSYDGEGHRVKKMIGSGSLAVTSTYVYDAGGKLVAEYATPTANSDLGTRYVTADHLGSTRIVTDGSKVVTTQTAANSAVKARYDYLPFGEEIASSIGGRSTIPGYVTSDTTRQKFTKYERDNESGLDYAKARYFGSSFGRFISPDPLLSSGKATMPQSWNRYTYCINNPLLLTDPKGLQWGYYDFGNGTSSVVWFKGKAGKYHGHQYTGFTPAKGGTVIPLAGGGAARIYQNGNREYLPGPAKITIRGQENVNAAAGAIAGLPGGEHIAGRIGGVDRDSQEYQNAKTISGSSVAGALMFTGAGEAEAIEEGAADLFEIHPRVLGQLQDTRLGDLAGKLTTDDLQALVNNPTAQRLFDATSGHINVVQQVDNVLLRITVPRDAMRIISVGPIRTNQVINGIASGRFIPLP